jgi:7-cyano-7-deazaguanine tRNA-ribosyltransferase
LLIVAGFTLKCIEPRVWDKTSPYYLPDLKAVMISYAEISQMPWLRERMMREGIHANLGIPADVKVFLDNGAFGLSRKGLEIEAADYEEFYSRAFDVTVSSK